MTKLQLMNKMNKIEDDDKVRITIDGRKSFELKDCLYNFSNRNLEIYDKNENLIFKRQYANIKSLEISNI